jgi:hypothetical protein
MSGRNWGRVMRILCMSAMLGVLLNGCKERGDIWNIRDGQRMRFSQDFSDKNLPPGASATSIVIAEVHLPAPPDFTKTLIQPRGPIVIVIADEGQSGSSKIGIKSDFDNYQPSKVIRGRRGKLYSKEGIILAVIVDAHDKEVYLLPVE